MENEAKNVSKTEPFETLLQDKELLSRLSGIIQGLKSVSPETGESSVSEASTPPTDALATPVNDPLSAALSNPALMAKLPSLMAALSPALTEGAAPKKPPDKRTALLSALRPYLSESRREVIDYMTCLETLGHLIKNLKL